VFLSYVLTLPPPLTRFFFVPQTPPHADANEPFTFSEVFDWRGLHDEWRRDLPINDLVLERVNLISISGS
jgi:hypothetical protein